MTETKVIAPSTLDAEWAAALERLAWGVRDRKAMDQAAREMDEGREEIRTRLGELNVAVELVREARDTAPTIDPDSRASEAL